MKLQKIYLLVYNCRSNEMWFKNLKDLERYIIDEEEKGTKWAENNDFAIDERIVNIDKFDRNLH